MNEGNISGMFVVVGLCALLSLYLFVEAVEAVI